ncbi:hypothetical protein [Nocardia sp. NPDC059239]|uniref:ATP-dependent DNA ligase n=1 Tax=Nocardia sp. NPDC059239 TaxID=3346785 RepID=UPI003675DDBF
MHRCPLCELKFDGQRALIVCKSGVWRILSRTLREITGTYADMAAVLDAAHGHDGCC